MIKFGSFGKYSKEDAVEVRRKVMELAIEAAGVINTDVFKKPIKIEFEKV